MISTARSNTMRTTKYAIKLDNTAEQHGTMANLRFAENRKR